MQHLLLILLGVGLLLATCAVGAVLVRGVKALVQFEKNAARRFDHHFLTAWPLVVVVLVAICGRVGLARLHAEQVFYSMEGDLLLGASAAAAMVLLLRNFRRTKVHFAVFGSLLQMCVVALGVWGGWPALCVCGLWAFADVIVRHPLLFAWMAPPKYF